MGIVAKLILGVRVRAIVYLCKLINILVPAH